MIDYDDKDLVIVATLIIAVMSLLVLKEPTTVVTAIISGLFGIAVGRAGKDN